jgi:hypothetical protein
MAITRALRRQVQCKRAMVGEAVEGLSVLHRELPGADPVGALIEKGAGLLPGPGRGEVPDRALPDLDLLGDGAERRLHGKRQSLAPANRSVVAEQDSRRIEHGRAAPDVSRTVSPCGKR